MRIAPNKILHIISNENDIFKLKLESDLNFVDLLMLVRQSFLKQSSS